jgi:tetratricopeptide (TPR) repeat protein
LIRLKKIPFFFFSLIVIYQIRSQPLFNDSLLKLIRSSKDSALIGSCYINLSATLMNQGQPDASVRYTKLAMSYYSRKKDTARIMDCYVNFGNAYSELGAGNAAISYYFEALKLAELRKDTTFLATIYSSVGAELLHEGDYQRSKYFLEKALENANRNKLSSAGILNNLGILYRSIGNYYYAERSYVQAIQMCRKFSDIRTAMQTYNNLGAIQEIKNDLDSAEKCYKVSLRISIRNVDRFQEELVLGNLGTLAAKKNDLLQAETLFKKSLLIAAEVHDLEGIAGMNLELAKLYKKLKKSDLSVVHYGKYVELKDELDKVNNEKGRQQAQLRYEYEKEKLELVREQEKLSLIEQAEKRKQQFIIYSVSICLIIVAVFFAFLYKRFKVTSAQKLIIEEQKKLVEHKQKEVLDSIHYAKRIQLAQIPSEKRVFAILKRMQARK